jgi:hypothetical protein
MKHPFKVCKRKHCKHLATVLPVIRVPAVGRPVRPDEDLSSGAMKIPLCGHHFMTLACGEILTKAVQRRIAAACRRDKSAKPDFARAYKQSVPNLIPEHV